MNIIESNLKFSSLSNLGTVKRIILHHAEATGCTIEDIDSWHKNNGWAGCGYHFYIRKDGIIYRGRPEDKLGAHTSNNNTGSLGICFEGKYQTEIMPEAQIKAGQELVNYLCNKYKLNKSNVYKHKDFNSTSCPGAKFPFNEIVNSNTTNINTSTSNITTSTDYSEYANYVGDRCKELQTLLIALGYNCGGYGADGIFGKGTYESLIKFQKDYGLKGDGLAGEATFNKLNELIDNKNSSYKVKITASELNVRKGAGTNYSIVTTVKKNEVYTIVEEKNGWGKLKSGAGWISLSYTTKM